MKIYNRDITFYIEQEDIEIKRCGEPVLLGFKVGGAYEKPFEMEPTTGKHDFNVCEKCKSYLIRITDFLRKEYEGKSNKPPFPLCCSFHKQLITLEEYKQSDFAAAPEMTARKVIFTNQHIFNFINDPGWYNEITDYIDYAIESFGKMPNGFGNPLFLLSYLHYIKGALKSDKIIDKLKADAIVSHIKTYEKNDTTETPKKNTDLVILEEIYQQWLKAFPFELNTYFGYLKDQFHKYIPLIQGNIRYNKYLGISIGKSHTQESLFNWLVDTTERLLTTTTGDVLFEKGIVTEIDKLQIDLINQSRKQKLKEGYKDTSPNAGQRYSNMINEWLEDEKKYWGEIKAVVPTTAVKAPTEESKLTHREMIFAHHYKVQTNEAEFRNGNQWYIENGSKGNWKQQFSTTDKNNKQYYKAPSESELKHIIELLEGFEAQKIAINLLAELEN